MEPQEDAASGGRPVAPGGAGSGSLALAAFALALVVAAVLALLDRRLVSAERVALQAEVQSLHARLEKSADVVPLRLELEEKTREIATLQASVEGAQRAMDAWETCDGLERLVMRGAAPAGASSGSLFLRRDGGVGLFVGTDLRPVAPGSELVRAASVGARERELARFRPDARGRAIVAFVLEEPSASLSRSWLKAAPHGKPAAGVPLLHHSRTGS